MTTTTDRRHLVGASLGLAIGLVALVTGALVLREHGPGNMWAGYLAGATLALLAAGVAFWRTWRRPAQATTAERVFTASADERDRAILHRAAATLGGVALPLTGAAAVLLALGVEPAPVIGSLLWTELVVFVAAFAVANRKL